MLNMAIKNNGNSFEFGFFEDKAFSKKEERIEKKKENTEKDYFTITNLVNINGAEEGRGLTGWIEKTLLKVRGKELGRVNFIFPGERVIGWNNGENFPTVINLEAEEKKLIHLNINGEIVKAIFYFIVDSKIGTTTEFRLEFTPKKGFVFKPRINLPSKTVIRKMDCLFSF